jgi:menaquinone-9 beta-reductase
MSVERFDVVIVGARCAGSPLATLLARAGLRVCVVDKARFPSDTPSTHMVQPVGVQILERLGVLDDLLKVAAPIEGGVAVFDDVRVELDGVRDLVGGPALNARRVTLDAILVEGAARAGAEVRTGLPVTGLVEEGGRVAGVTTPAGELRAPLVVGADGARSTVARLVGAGEYHRTPPGRIFLWAYFEGARPGHDGLWLGKLRDHAFLASPSDAGLFMAAVVPDIHRRDEVRADREAAFTAGLRDWPELEAALAGARRVGPIQLMSNWHGFFRESAGPGWVLVGDAGHFKDPTPGQGIADALRQVVKLAPAIERSLGGDERALRDWWSWRDRDAWEMYWFAHDLGAPGPTPLPLIEIQRRMSAEPRLAQGLMRVLNHDVPPSEVFRPGLFLRATSRALLTARGRRRTVLRDARVVVRNAVRRGTLART